MARSRPRRQQRIAEKLDQEADHDAPAQAKVLPLAKDPWTAPQQHQALHLRRPPVDRLTGQPRTSSRGNGCESTHSASIVGTLDIGAKTQSVLTSVQAEKLKSVAVTPVKKMWRTLKFPQQHNHVHDSGALYTQKATR